MIEQFIHEHFPDAKRSSNGWQARCPAHDDAKASLAISDGREGRVLLKCFAGCELDDILRSLQIEKTDLFPKSIHNSPRAATSSAPVGDVVYDYVDEDGTLIMQAVRRPDKSFAQRKPDGRGGWVWKLGKIKRVLYRLPELIASSGVVFIAEGEKDVDNIRKLGLTATCNVGGAGKWRDEYGVYLTGRKVVILPDNDDPGRKHADQVAKLLSTVTDTIKIVELPDLPVKGDVSDWIAAGGTKEQILKIAGDAPRYIQPAKRIAGGEIGKPKDYELNDIGNGRRFADLYGDRIKYCYSLGCWMVWDGRRWDIGRGEAASRVLAAEMVEEMKDYAVKNSDIRLKSWGIECSKSARITSILLEAKGRLAVYSDELDADPWLLNCQNGIIDLRTGDLLDHNPDLLMTKIASAEYKPGESSQVWNDFLYSACNEDSELIQFLMMAVGYSLTGSTAEEKLFFVHGPGAAGKSTFIEAVKSTLGDYATTSDFETFLAKNNDGGVRNDIARLKGSRLVASIEVDDGRRLAEGLVKTITGSDTISARYLYRESFEFRPQFKLWLCANHEPRVREDDDAIWRRILRIPFTNAIPKDKRDPKIKADLTNPEISGAAILAWAVWGCQQWQQFGLPVPETITKATDDYRNRMDPLADWINDCLELDQTSKTPVAQLRDSYEQWAKAEGVKFTVGRNGFNDRMRALGLTIVVGKIGAALKSVKCWKGVSIVDGPVLYD